MYQFYFEKLEVWQRSRSLTKEVYLLTSKFPDSERFGIISQLRRASSSIGANIAEGMHRSTNKDKARFINQSNGCCMEVLNFLILSTDLEFTDDTNYLLLREKIELIANQLNSLHKSLLA